MRSLDSGRAFRIFLFGGASALLILDVFFLLKSVWQTNFVPVVPLLAGIFTAFGLLLILYSEQRARDLDRADHRRISRVAHQLEAPLATLQSDLEYLIKRAGKLPAEERMKLKRMASKTAITLDNIRDVFLMMRAHDTAISQDKREYDVCAVVEEAINHTKTLASARNIELTHKQHCQNAPVILDKRLAKIALIHVIENALLYTVTPGLVNIAITKGEKYVRIIVQDRGIGVNAEDQYAIFLPFARGKQAEKHDPDGIGVGLTLAKLIVKEFEGDLIWRPRPGGETGSEFEIKLPLVHQK